MAALTLAYATVAVGVLYAPLGAGKAERSEVLRRAALFGGVVGSFALGAIALDTLVEPQSVVRPVAWSVASLVALLCWGLVGLTATRASGSWRLGIVAALWSGMVSALVAAPGEVATTVLALPRLVHDELSNPDYLYWHRPDLQSYAIASALALGMMGPVLVPVVAGVAGGVGSWLGGAGGLAASSNEPTH